MSDTYLRLIPGDPSRVPAALARERALGLLRRAADGPVIRGQQRGAPPQLTDLERPLAELLFGAVDALPGASSGPGT